MPVKRTTNPSYSFFGRLKRLNEDCECTSLTVQAHEDYLVRNAQISGLRSDDIRARLLELEDSKADIDSCISLSCGIELSNDFSKSFRSAESSTAAASKPFSQTTRQQPDRPRTSAAQQFMSHRNSKTFAAKAELRAPKLGLRTICRKTID